LFPRSGSAAPVVPGAAGNAETGAGISEIARETGLNWRTVKKDLEDDGPAARRCPRHGQTG
jgi:hypothetical protein